jgi:hypothetical protein
VVGPTQGPGLYLLGLLIVALYAPLYWWRAWQDRRLTAKGKLGGQLAPAALGDVLIEGRASSADPPAVPDPAPDTETSGEPPVMR